MCPSTGTTVCVSIRLPSINNNVTKRHHNKLKKKIIFVEINILGTLDLLTKTNNYVQKKN